MANETDEQSQTNTLCSWSVILRNCFKSWLAKIIKLRRQAKAKHSIEEFYETFQYLSETWN